MIFPSEGLCPCCQSRFRLHDLKRVPFAGRLRWYEFTPAPRLACPACERMLVSSVASSRWLYLPFLICCACILVLLFGLKLPFYVAVAAAAIAVFGVFMAARHAVFSPDERAMAGEE